MSSFFKKLRIPSSSSGLLGKVMFTSLIAPGKLIECESLSPKLFLFKTMVLVSSLSGLKVTLSVSIFVNNSSS